MSITLTDIERESYKDSIIHRLDGRFKIIATIAIIIYVVSLPRLDEYNLMRLSILEIYLVALLMIGKLNPIYILVRLIAVLPFGLGIAMFQPFIRQPFIESFTIYPLSLPFGLTITYEGVGFGIELLAKFTVCVTAIILMSSTMKMNDIVISARRLGAPKEFTLLLTMMVRYLFVFWAVLKRIRVAQKSRLFNIWNKKVPRKWVIEQVGNTISALFVQSYEQGERTYTSMLCRGYGNDHNSMYIHKNKLGIMDILFFAATFTIILGVHIYF